MAATVVSPINFLSRHDTYELEKPYNLKFEPPPEQPYTNIIPDPRQKAIQDVRGREQGLSLKQNGFAVLTLDECMTYEDFDDKVKCRDVYCKQVAEGLKEMLGARRVQIFEFVIRKRHPDFPIATGEAYEFNQPTNTAHIDMTPAWALETLETMNPNQDVPSSNFQFVNIWKPLRGPVHDWPLALCDPATVRSTDVCESDIVFEDQVIENYLVHANQEHQWYYLSEQTASEAWVFLQADLTSTSTRRPYGVPHCSFQHPDAAKSQWPRESIEVRAVVYYDGAESSVLSSVNQSQSIRGL